MFHDAVTDDAVSGDGLSDDGVATLSITIDASDRQVVVSVQGELDAATAEPLERALAAIDSIDCDTVVVDMAEVSFIDSSGLQALLNGRHDLARHDVGLVICNPQGQARRLFEVALAAAQFESLTLASLPLYG